MFKFNTTTVINSEFNPITNEPMWEKVGRFVKDGDNQTPTILRIDHGPALDMNYVKAIYYRPATDPQLAGFSFTPPTTPGHYRIALYIRLQGSNNEYYANDYVFKGKPFYIEYIVKDGDSAADIAARVQKITKKYMQMVYEQPLVKVTVDDSDVKFEAIDEYQRFTQIELQKWDDTIGLTNACCGNVGGFAKEADIDSESSPFAWLLDDDDNPRKGKEGFGTYRFLIKNLRLPTADNLKWGSIMQNEMPVPGKKYDQYTIWYCRKVGIQGLDAVGDVTQSLTSHIFYVDTAISQYTSQTGGGEPEEKGFMADLEALYSGDIITVTDTTEANSVINNPNNADQLLNND